MARAGAAASGRGTGLTLPGPFWTLQLIQEFKELELNYTKDSAISDPGGEPADAE